MENIHSAAVDKAMTGLLLMGFPVDIGIPAWAIAEMLGRAHSPLASNDVLGQSFDFKEKSILSDYRDMQGYQFSWGTLSEESSLNEEKMTAVCRFEFCLRNLMLAFPQPAMIEDLITWMYSNHPLYDQKFSSNESYGDWFVLSFEARDAKKITMLRRWLAKIFIPKILPDLILECLSIIESAKENEFKRTGSLSFEDLLIEKTRYQLCGNPLALSFTNVK